MNWEAHGTINGLWWVWTVGKGQILEKKVTGCNQIAKMVNDGRSVWFWMADG
jgi:hypothetical protein